MLSGGTTVVVLEGCCKIMGMMQLNVNSCTFIYQGFERKGFAVAGTNLGPRRI
jgi:hypothetical protein